MEAEANQAERELSAADTRLEGSLRITATDGFAHYVLLPALGEFLRDHPGLSVEVRTDNRVLDLSRREADVAVRLARPKEPALIARRLGQIHWSLFASEAYLERRGTPRNVAALATHDFIGVDASLDDQPQVKWLRRMLPEPRYVLRAATTTPQVLACAEGYGIALLPTFVLAREARLRRTLPRLAGPSRELWGVTHADLRGNARTSALLVWLAGVVDRAAGSRPTIA
jgi:DNA-binding transcriptional LysR family regulator